MLEDLKLETQSVLDALLKEGLIPFPLSVGSIKRYPSSMYQIRFFDSRIRSVDFYCGAAQPFKDVCRIAVLDRVAKMSGPLTKKAGGKTTV